MAASTKPPRQSAWPDLTLDLLGDVLSRLPSLADRTRFRAVCRPWRTLSTLLPPAPPQLPWFALPNGTVLDVANKKTHRLRIPRGGCLCYSPGGNIFFLHHSRDGRCSVANGFSGAATPLPELAALLKSYMVSSCDGKIKKVVMSMAASSPNHQPLVAVLVSDRWKSRVFISTCRPAGEINWCVAMREISTILDIAFFQGKMYANLEMHEELVAIDLCSNGCCLIDTPTTSGEVKQYTSWIFPPNLPEMYIQDLFDNFVDYAKVESEVLDRYLVESNGKLLMVRRHDATGSSGHLACRFEVFEADLSGGPRLGRWNKADSLDGWALFVSTACSKSVRAAAHGDDGPRGDCIYFLLNHGNPLHKSAGVYSLVDKTTMPLIPVSASPSRRAKLSSCVDSQRFLAWFFPVEV